jgi:hypothetical protein
MGRTAIGAPWLLWNFGSSVLNHRFIGLPGQRYSIVAKDDTKVKGVDECGCK